MIETHEKEINGATYSVTQMPAMRAIRMQARLLKLLGPSCAELFVAYQQDEKKQEDQADKHIPHAITLLVNQLDEKTFESLVIDLLQGVRKDGMELKKEIIDLEFAGNLNTLFLLIKFILEVNFSDFFLPGGIIYQLKEKEEPKTIPQKSKRA